MRVYELIFEDYKTATVKFNQFAEPDEVKNFIDQYRDLVNRNQVQGQERNIDYWAKQGWEQFKEFVSKKASQPSVTQVKRKQSVGQSITLSEDNNWLIVIPLNHDASCFHGRDTQWCTARPHAGYFQRYFLDRNIILVYCLQKSTGAKWAIAIHQDDNKIEYFDQQDKKINEADFEKQTDLSVRKIFDIIPYDDPRITKARADRKVSVDQLKDMFEKWISGDFSRSPELEQLLASVKNTSYSSTYIEKVGEHHGPQDYQGLAGKTITWAAISDEPKLLQYVKNPSDSLQIEAVKRNPYIVKSITNLGDKANLLVIENDPMLIRYIKNPSEAVQMAAVKKKGNAIEYIQNPSEQVKMAAVESRPRSILYIDDPSEQIQMAAIQKDPRIIYSIGREKLDIKPLDYILNLKGDDSDLAQLKRYAKWTKSEIKKKQFIDKLKRLSGIK